MGRARDWMLSGFQQQCPALPAADTERRQAPLHSSTFHFAKKRDSNSRAGGADRMPEGDGAAVDVQAARIDVPQFAIPAQALSGELIRGKCDLIRNDLNGE